jgi:hypothetical protein
LKSLLEFTHPGFVNNGVYGLSHGAGSDGVYRNITQGGLQDQAGFTERADGVLVYVPGWGASGIILGLAGGTAETFVSNYVITIISGFRVAFRISAPSLFWGFWFFGFTDYALSKPLIGALLSRLTNSLD